MNEDAPAISALGPKPTYTVQNIMSALGLIATTKSGFPEKSCLLYPQKQTCAVQWLMSALGQKRTCLYSITSSARERSDDGTVRPSVLAVFRLIASSNLVGACTGRSAGFSPLRIRST